MPAEDNGQTDENRAAKASSRNRKDYVLSGMGRKWVESRRQCLALKTLKTTVNRLLTLL